MIYIEQLVLGVTWATLSSLLILEFYIESQIAQRFSDPVLLNVFNYCTLHVYRGIEIITRHQSFTVFISAIFVSFYENEVLRKDF